jgi:hypothetical protein
MASRIQLRRDTAANWTSVNPVLAIGEIGIELDTMQYKLGDGVSAWSSLSYKGLNGEQGIQGIQGVQGIPGADGAQGVKGDAGTPGAKGDQGIQGIQGIPGSDATVTKSNVEAVLTGTISSHSHTGSGAAWGGITGTLSAQTDLNSALGGKEAANANIQTHVASAHAPSNAQANADITKAEIEAKLIGEISSHTHAGGAGGLGYTINVQALTSSPADSATVYFGMLPKAPTTTANTSKIYIRKAGTIKIAEIYVYSGTAGTAESWSLYIRKNNSADTLIATVAVSASERVFTNSALSIAVAAGDYVEIKGIQPLWATNPLTTVYGGYIYVE